MSSLLNQVVRGKIRQPILALVYGADGVGKSTFGADAPNPIFLGTEKGTANLDVARYPAPSTFKAVLDAVDDIALNAHDFETLVIDSLDWLEPLVWEQVCVENNIKSIEDLGYGKGYVHAIDKWRTLSQKLTILRERRKMHIILIAHAQVKNTKDPHTQSDYDRYQLKLNDKAAALWREYVDAVLFANFETFVKSDKSGKTRAFGEGARYIFTERRPGFDAKNRHGLPFQLPLEWAAFKEAVDSGMPESPEVLTSNIRQLIQEITNEATRVKAEEFLANAGANTQQLEKLQNKLRALVAV